MTDLLQNTLAAIKPTSAEALAAARARQSQLTKPEGSLGVLEDVGCRLGAIQGTEHPSVPQHGVLAVFAGDHGVHAQGITPWPQEVTVQMLVNICYGGASVNALSAETGAEVWPVDAGMVGEMPDAPNLRRMRVANGTADFTQRPAMTREQAVAGLEVGIKIAQEAIAAGADILLTGEVGLGNTTAGAAIISTMAGADPELTTGRGAGSNDAMLAHKVEVIRAAQALNAPDPADPLGVLAALGGYDIAGMAGLVLGGAAAGVPVVLDGVISCSAALIAVSLAPAAGEYLIAGHAGAEPGIHVALDKLGLHALVDLGLRLGEGSGALVALPLVRQSARILTDMATFEEAGVSGKEE